MKHRTLRLLAMILAVLTLLCALPATSVFAAESNTAAGLTYQKDGNNAVITGYSGASSEVIIPEKIGSLTVTEIAKEAFVGKKITYLSIPETIKEIGKDAFLNCNSIKTVDIEDIGAWCEIDFANENSNPAKSGYARLCFNGAEISSLYIPDGTKKISAFAFYGNTNIKKVFIPQSVKSIGEMAFRGANYVEDVYCVATGKTWEEMTSEAPAFIRDSADVWLINPDETPLHGLKYTEEDGKITITGYEGNLYKLQIPSTIDGKPVVKIDDYAFARNNALAEVILPDSITDIYSGVFFECKYLAKVNIPSKVDFIFEETFRDCHSLRDITIPPTVKEISYFAFNGCRSLTKIEISEGTEAIEDHAFSQCYNLSDISLPDSLTQLAGTAFYETAYYNDESNWVNGVLYIDNYLCMVDENAKGKFVVKDGTRIIPAQVFENNLGITEIVLPDSVTTIRYAAFAGCENLKSINLPEGITEIPERAFDCCYSLEKIEIPSTVTKIGANAFDGCKKITEIKLPEGVTEIGRGAFALCGFESITLPEGVTRIEDTTFRYCKNLKEVNIGPNIEYITAGAFTDTPLYNDDNWEETEFYLDYCLLFYDNEKSKEYTIKDGTRVVGVNAFRSYSDLEVLNVPESVEVICDGTLLDSFRLKTINFGGSELQWNGIIQNADTGLSKDVEVTFAKESEFIQGDVTLDGKLNIRDATAIQKHMAKIELLKDKAIELADFNNDGKLNVRDATAIQKKIAGL